MGYENLGDIQFITNDRKDTIRWIYYIVIMVNPKTERHHRRYQMTSFAYSKDAFKHLKQFEADFKGKLNKCVFALERNEVIWRFKSAKELKDERPTRNNNAG